MRMRRIAIGSLLGVGGILFTMLAVFIAQAGQDQRRLMERSYAAADLVCREQLQKMGAVKDQDAGRVWEVFVPVVADKRTALGDASAAVSACPTRAMQFFCMGPGCRDPENVKPAPTRARRPASMIIRMELRPGVVVAQTAEPEAPATPPRQPPAPRPSGGQPSVGMAAHPAQQPARSQPARPSAVLPQPIPQVR